MSEKPELVFHSGDRVAEDGMIFQEIGTDALGIQNFVCLDKGAELPPTSHPAHYWKERDLWFLQSALR